MRKKTNEGITLIALVITIIVLLVLAGATLAMISGDNGILKKVVQAKQSTQKASVEEKVKLAIQSALSSDYNEHGKITKETLIQELGKNGLIENENDLEEIEGIKWGLSTNDKKYIIYSDGKVEVEQSKLPAGYKELEYIESTGTQCIDTGIYPSSEYKAITEVSNHRGKDNGVIFGSRIRFEYEPWRDYAIDCFAYSQPCSFRGDMGNVLGQKTNVDEQNERNK